MTKDDRPTVFEVIEWRRGVTQQDGEQSISHGLFGNRYRANLKRRELRKAGVRDTVAIERRVD